MIVLLAVTVAAGLTGGLLGYVAGRSTKTITGQTSDVDTDEPLTDHDRSQVASAFAEHVNAVRRGVSDYADHLAGDDAALRARLRGFERGDQS